MVLNIYQKGHNVLIIYPSHIIAKEIYKEIRTKLKLLPESFILVSSRGIMLKPDDKINEKLDIGDDILNIVDLSDSSVSINVNMMMTTTTPPTIFKTHSLNTIPIFEIIPMVQKTPPKEQELKKYTVQYLSKGRRENAYYRVYDTLGKLYLANVLYIGPRYTWHERTIDMYSHYCFDIFGAGGSLGCYHKNIIGYDYMFETNSSLLPPNYALFYARGSSGDDKENRKLLKTKWLISEYYELTLEDVIKHRIKKNRLPLFNVKEIWRVCCDISNALILLNQEKLIAHRALQPSSIIVRIPQNKTKIEVMENIGDDEDISFAITDFYDIYDFKVNDKKEMEDEFPVGLLRHCGHPFYASPEIMLGDGSSKMIVNFSTSDLWSLGMIMLLMMSNNNDNDNNNNLQTSHYINNYGEINQSIILDRISSCFHSNNNISLLTILKEKILIPFCDERYTPKELFCISEHLSIFSLSENLYFSIFLDFTSLPIELINLVFNF
jgi:serine/threonine protein kinase